MPYDPKAIANYFLELAERDNRPLSPMKIQKLIYYANGWYLGITGEPLIDEQVEAWTFGPVIPSIYREFREFGNRPITERATNIEYEPKSDGAGYMVKVLTPSVQDDWTLATVARPVLDRVWDVYGGYSAVQLANMTHEKGSPWEQVVTSYAGKWPRGTDIPIETIRKHFRELYENGKAES